MKLHNRKVSLNPISILLAIAILVSMSVIPAAADNIQLWYIDLNGDGRFSLKDVSLIQKYSCGLQDLTSEQLNIADVNDDGSVDLKDAYILQQLINEIYLDDDIGIDTDTQSDEDTDTQTDEVTDTQSDEDTDTQTDEVTDTQSDKDTDTQTDEVTDTKSDEHTDTQTDEKTDTQSDEDTDTSSDVSTDTVDPFVSEVLRLVNIEREKEGISPLVLDMTLCEIADIRASEIHEVFSHTRPDGSDVFDLLDEYNFPWFGAGENIAAGYASPAAVVTGWMNSPGHRSNILNPDYRKIGIGHKYYSNDMYGHYWVQVFTN